MRSSAQAREVSHDIRESSKEYVFAPADGRCTRSASDCATRGETCRIRVQCMHRPAAVRVPTCRERAANLKFIQQVAATTVARLRQAGLHNLTIDNAAKSNTIQRRHLQSRPPSNHLIMGSPAKVIRPARTLNKPMAPGIDLRDIHFRIQPRQRNLVFSWTTSFDSRWRYLDVIRRIYEPKSLS